MKEWLRHILPLLLAVLLPAGMLRAQDNGVFKSDAFSQSYADPSDTLGRDSTDAAFTFKEYFGGMTHRRGALFVQPRHDFHIFKSCKYLLIHVIS